MKPAPPVTRIVFYFRSFCVTYFLNNSYRLSSLLVVFYHQFAQLFFFIAII